MTQPPGHPYPPVGDGPPPPYPPPGPHPYQQPSYPQQPAYGQQPSYGQQGQQYAATPPGVAPYPGAGTGAQPPYAVSPPAYLQGSPGYPARPKSGGSRGLWLGLGALLAVGALAVVGVIAVNALQKDEGSDATGASVPSATSSSASPSSGFADGQQIESSGLRVGDCVRAKADGEVSTLKAVSCTSAHYGEVVGMYKVTGGTYPGESAITEEAERRCNGFVPDNVDDHDELVLYYLYPQQESWTLGDRDVRCLVVSEGAPLTKKVAAL